MSSQLIGSLRKRLRRVWYASLVLLIVLVPATRTLLASVIPSASAAVSNRANHASRQATSRPSQATTASAQTPRSTRPRH